MSLINRPFRGFSGVYTMPLPPLPSPSSTSTSLDSQRSTSSTSLSSVSDAPKPRRSLFHRSKTSPNNQKHMRAPGPASTNDPPSSSRHVSAAMARPAPPCRAHTADLPTPSPPKSRFHSLLRRHREGCAPSSADVQKELEELYVAVYSKAERRQFFREWKARQEERDAWEVEAWERGIVFESGEEKD